MARGLVVSAKICAEDRALLRFAAEAEKVTVSEFIRRVTLVAARQRALAELAADRFDSAVG